MGVCTVYLILINAEFSLQQQHGNKVYFGVQRPDLMCGQRVAASVRSSDSPANVK